MWAGFLTACFSWDSAWECVGCDFATLSWLSNRLSSELEIDEWASVDYIERVTAVALSVEKAPRGRRKKVDVEEKLDVEDMDTRSRLVHFAARLFAERGIDGVSTRDITTAANSNSASIGYYFKTKENLVREVFETLAGPMNRARLDALTDYELLIGPEGEMDVEEVARCLIAPAIRLASDPTHDAHYLGRLLHFASAMPWDWIGEVLAKQYDEVFRRFVQAFQRALPGESYETVAWRYDFLVGSVLYAFRYFDGSSRIGRVTSGACDPNDVERVIQEMVGFAGGAMRAAPVIPSQKKARSRS